MRQLADGYVRKMRVSLDADGEARYFWSSDTTVADVSMNSLLGHTIVLRYRGDIACIYCGRKTSKSFSQGYCYPCCKNLARCDLCIVRPHTCHYDAGTCREPEWAASHCMTSHTVYLAETSALKVGLTRTEQIPVRWLDQGAVRALPIASTSTRKQAGCIEHLCASQVADSTQWRAMLRHRTPGIDLSETRGVVLRALAEQMRTLLDSFGDKHVSILEGEQAQDFRYPVLCYPDKISSFNLDKNAEVKGRLQGIKGQYLILDDGVINIRKYGGYGVDLLVCD